MRRGAPWRAALAAALILAALLGDGLPLHAQTHTPSATAGDAPGAAPASAPGAAAAGDARRTPRARTTLVSATLLQVLGDPPVVRRAAARKRDRSVNPFDPESLRRFFEE